MTTTITKNGINYAIIDKDKDQIHKGKNSLLFKTRDLDYGIEEIIIKMGKNNETHNLSRNELSIFEVLKEKGHQELIDYFIGEGRDEKDNPCQIYKNLTADGIGKLLGRDRDDPERRNSFLISIKKDQDDLNEARISLQEKLNPVLATYIYSELLNTIATLQTVEICHSDISLENVIISEEGKVKLIDYNIGRKIGSPIEKGYNGELIEGGNETEDEGYATNYGRNKNAYFQSLYSPPDEFLGTNTHDKIDSYMSTNLYCLMITGEQIATLKNELKRDNSNKKLKDLIIEKIDKSKKLSSNKEYDSHLYSQIAEIIINGTNNDPEECSTVKELRVQMDHLSILDPREYLKKQINLWTDKRGGFIKNSFKPTEIEEVRAYPYVLETPSKVKTLTPKPKAKTSKSSEKEIQNIANPVSELESKTKHFWQKAKKFAIAASATIILGLGLPYFLYSDSNLNQTKRFNFEENSLNQRNACLLLEENNYSNNATLPASFESSSLIPLVSLPKPRAENTELKIESELDQLKNFNFTDFISKHILGNKYAWRKSLTSPIDIDEGSTRLIPLFNWIEQEYELESSNSAISLEKSSNDKFIVVSANSDYNGSGIIMIDTGKEKKHLRVNINPVNDTPQYYNANKVIAFNEDEEQMINLYDFFKDVESDDLNFKFKNGKLKRETKNYTLEIDDFFLTIKPTPDYHTPNKKYNTIDIIANDGIDQTEGEIKFKIKPVNDAPRYKESEFSLKKNHIYTIFLNNIFYDPDGDKITYQVLKNKSNCSEEMQFYIDPENPSQLIVNTPVFKKSLTYEIITVSASDGKEITEGKIKLKIK